MYNIITNSGCKEESFAGKKNSEKLDTNLNTVLLLTLVISFQLQAHISQAFQTHFITDTQR